jgi:hypothetical protein
LKEKPSERQHILLSNGGWHQVGVGGPQKDASHPKEGETITAEEVKYLLGYAILHMDSPIYWDLM